MNDNAVYIKDMNNDEYGIKKLQNKILEIAIYFDDFCKKNNIKYFLMSGSALGAIRHNGFIPWDDDLDVIMDFDNYNKLLSCINKIDTTRFYFQVQDSYENSNYFSKLRMKRYNFY